MATYIVTKVHKSLGLDRRHRHIAGVCTTDGHYFTRIEVVDSINAGHSWRTRAGGVEAEIEVVSFCHQRGCLASPYIQTPADSSLKDNLEHLDEC